MSSRGIGTWEEVWGELGKARVRHGFTKAINIAADKLVDLSLMTPQQVEQLFYTKGSKVGYYLNTPTVTDANQRDCDLATNHGAEMISKPVSLGMIAADKALICVVNNGPFQAAALIYDNMEFKDFSSPDSRVKTWLIMDKEKAWKLCGYKGE